ncbi:MAG TPA: hypothetical protein VFF67_02445 [Thermoplasmata archaeon]|nr:hypothetical protein [Thermoplasmata archaeon]
MREWGATSPNTARRVTRFLGASATAATLAVTLLMLTAPLAGASTTTTAPYAHTLSSTFKSKSSYGYCLTTASSHGTQWNPTTGHVRGVASSSAKSCVAPPLGASYSSANIYDYITVWIPIAVGNGGHNVSVTTSYAYTLTGSFPSLAACPLAANLHGQPTSSFCSYSILAGAYWQQALYDATNKSSLYGGNSYVSAPENYAYALDYSYCSGNGTCGTANYTYSCGSPYYYVPCSAWGTRATGTNTTWIDTGANCLYRYAGTCYYWSNWTLNAKHHYYVELSFEIYAGAYMQGLAGKTAAAGIDAAIGTNTGFKVASVAVA